MTVQRNPKSRIKQLLVCALCSASLPLQSCALFRVDLSAPSPQAPLAKRVVAYKALQPVGEEIPIETLRTRTEGGVSKTSRALILGNGIKVRNPEDLRVVVPPNSRTSKAIDEFSHYNRRGIPLKLGAFVLFTGAIATGMLGAVQYEESEQRGSTALWVSSGLLLAGAITTTVFAVRYSISAQKARYQAFKSYDQDLLNYLRIEEIPAEERDSYGPQGPEVAKAHRKLHSRPTTSSSTH